MPLHVLPLSFLRVRRSSSSRLNWCSRLGAAVPIGIIRRRDWPRALRVRGRSIVYVVPQLKSYGGVYRVQNGWLDVFSPLVGTESVGELLEVIGRCLPLNQQPSPLSRFLAAYWGSEIRNQLKFFATGCGFGAGNIYITYLIYTLSSVFV